MQQIKTNIRFLVLVSVFLLSFTQFLTTVYGQSGNDFKWPHGAKAAFCLTYDDGFFSHINKVVPLLKKYHFKATFYLTPVSGSINLEMEKWKSLAKDGHELGNHTVYHPCSKSGGAEWVKDYYDLSASVGAPSLSQVRINRS